MFRVLHVLSILTGPNIFLNICLSKMYRLFLSFAVKVQVSDEYVTMGIATALYRVSIKYFPDYKYLLQENYCTWNTNIFFFQNVTQEVFFLQHISTLQHVLLLFRGERLIDNQFLSTCSPTFLQLL